MISAVALVNRGEVAWIEDLILSSAPDLWFCRAIVVPRPVDREGITMGGRRKSAHLNNLRNSSHQFPLGMTMSLARRTALIDFARACDA